MNDFIGRNREILILQDALKSNKPELIAVYGRRRIGKTFLIREVYKKHIVFEFSGIYNESLSGQLKNFRLILSGKNVRIKKPADWIEAFYALGQFIDQITSKQKKVIFIDEFPWLDTRKSKFLPAFDNFWNNYASKRNDLIVVICGSAASYMINNILRSKGGLHNRITNKIHLSPFNLFETELLLRKNKVKLTRYDILQIYMAMGGVPYYLEKILPGESVAQCLDRLCFDKNGPLRSEFSNVFASLFSMYENHEAIIRKLASVRKGLTRNAILEITRIASGGTLTKTLVELEESGFIEKYAPYKGIKDPLYRLTDEYTLFYIRFIEHTKPSANGVWNKLYNQQPYKIWAGLCYETICTKHIAQIKEGLKISGIYAEQGSWISKKPEKGAQVDLLIDRADNVINLCEIKFYNTKFTIDKNYAQEVLTKVNVFTEDTKTNKSIFVTFITTYGLVPNQYSRQVVQNELIMDHLFIDL